LVVLFRMRFHAKLGSQATRTVDLNVQTSAE
jgi:hypothetical protein